MKWPGGSRPGQTNRDRAAGDDGHSLPRIVAYAYSCTPGGGSEHAVGWTWARMLAGFADVWVITLPTELDRADFEHRLAQVPERDRLHFVEVPIPHWLGRIPYVGQAGRFHRFEYFAWQFAALRVARRLHQEHPFDIAWHLTWANAWLGSTAARLGIPFVFGPVGGGVEPPWRLASFLGRKGMFSELQRTVVRWLARRLNPLAFVSWGRATLVLVQNPETMRWLPDRHRHKYVLFPNAVLEVVPEPRPEGRTPGTTALYAGRLIPLKGLPLALEAIRRLPGWRLVILGQGPDEGRLRALAARLGVTGRIEFRGMQTRAETMRVMREEADVMVFPSFHDEGSLAVVEAVATGLPVVCLDRGGPRTLGGIAVPIRSGGETIRLLADAIARSGQAAPGLHAPFDLETRRRDLEALLTTFGLLPIGAPR